MFGFFSGSRKQKAVVEPTTFLVTIDRQLGKGMETIFHENPFRFLLIEQAMGRNTVVLCTMKVTTEDAANFHRQRETLREILALGNNTQG